MNLSDLWWVKQVGKLLPSGGGGAAGLASLELRSCGGRELRSAEGLLGEGRGALRQVKLLLHATLADEELDTDELARALVPLASGASHLDLLVLLVEQACLERQGFSDAIEDLFMVVKLSCNPNLDRDGALLPIAINTSWNYVMNDISTA